MAKTAQALERAERKKDELRREIIEAAFSIFTERGYHATGIADIAKHLGIGHGTFYRYFKNKRDILDHVVSDTVERVIAALANDNAPNVATSSAEYRAQTLRIAQSLTTIFSEDKRVTHLLIFESTGIDPQLTDHLQGLLNLGTTVTAGYLENGITRGFLRANLDIENTARAVNGMILAGALYGLQTPNASDLSPYMDAAISVMFDSIIAE